MESGCDVDGQERISGGGQPRREISDAAVQTIELGETDYSERPVYKNPTVITVQPQCDNNPFRRPIPISTMDWVSTPRSQFSATSGTHFLAGVEQLEVQQIVDLSSLLGRSDKGNQYRVKVPRAETLFIAMESRAEDTQSICTFHQGFTMNILDQSGETAFTLKKNPGWRYFPGPLHKITMEASNLIGSVEENFSILGPSFTVYDAERNPLCNIYGPNVCSCCMYKEAQFQVLSIDGTYQIASLMHQWDHLMVDYSVLLTFPSNTDVRLKSLLLGASFLMEHLYFEKVKRATRR